ncbi:CAP domain-containing protein [Bacillus sp. XF8]|uniref:CAP domain-containing protein n=1 Tax=Bacillus sp. XF8 TaxID=2819289 RepID=UPI001AA05E2D|nr:CAP domain-containing protein [Bacillus sp. XF8]MBO1580712.1 hypothetical protein [Bacillus sp. XF8]
MYQPYYTYDQCMFNCQSGPDGGNYYECNHMCKKYKTHPWYTVPYGINQAPIVAVPYGVTQAPVTAVPYGMNQAPMATVPSSSYTYDQCMAECQAGGGYSYECAPACKMFGRPSPYGISSVHALFMNERQMISRINGERQKAGKHGLSIDQRLANVAYAKARDMATIGRCPAEHYSPTFGGDEGTMLKNAGITAANFGWIIYCGQPGTASEAVNWWMNISTYGHRENILNSSFNRFGVGTAVSRDGRRYWSVIFSS